MESLSFQELSIVMRLLKAKVMTMNARKLSSSDPIQNATREALLAKSSLAFLHAKQSAYQQGLDFGRLLESNGISAS